MSVQAVIDLGTSYGRAGDFNAALTCFRQALLEDPGNAEAELNIGSALADLGEHARALPFAAAAAAKLDTPLANGNHGILLYRAGRFSEAEAAFRKVLAVDADNGVMQYNLAFALLAQGRYEAGWQYLAARKQTAQWAGREPYPDLPTWTGNPLMERTLALFHEQGFGDSIMLSRYIPAAQRRGGKVHLICPPELAQLFTDSFRVPAYSAAEAPPADCQCSLFDLPTLFGITLDSIPQPPFLRTNPTQVAAWRQTMAGLPGRRVGLVWAGEWRTDPGSRRMNDRTTTLASMAPLFEVPGVDFISLQKGTPAEQIDDSGLPIHAWTDQLVDFAATAALIKSLDLVISVDTSVVHLAAGLGKPVWLLTCFHSCWRWLVNPNPWYRSVPLREFCQPAPGDWHSVIDAVKRALTTGE